VTTGRPSFRTLATRLAVAAALVVADLWSKAAVFAWLEPHPAGVLVVDDHGHARYRIFGDWFAFYLTTNPGMAWGFDKLPPWLLVGGRCLAVLFLLWLVVTTPRERRVLAASLTLILSGAVGNLYDNLFLAPPEGRSFGEVRDFLDVYFSRWDWHFPTFNVADACISVGAVLLLGASFLTKEEPAASEVSRA
jgi:signal peptidase II